MKEQGRTVDRLLDRKFGNDAAQKDEYRDMMNGLAAEGDAAERISAKNHELLVERASREFTPEQAGRKVKLRLLLGAHRIPPAGKLLYQLGLQNVGSQAIDYSELSPSIFKFNGIGYSPTITFFVTGPSGKRQELHAALPIAHGAPGSPPVEFLPNDLPEEQKRQWFADTRANAAALQHFQVRLEPGETLRTRDAAALGSSDFRTLWCEEGFTRPGKYSIQVVLDDRPNKPDEDLIAIMMKAGESRATIERHYAEDLKKAIGPISSDPVTFEVVR